MVCVCFDENASCERESVYEIVSVSNKYNKILAFCRT